MFYIAKNSNLWEQFFNPFNNMREISKLYLLHLVCNFHIPWLIPRSFGFFVIYQIFVFTSDMKNFIRDMTYSLIYKSSK